jgi:homoserine dehydrogenase
LAVARAKQAGNVHAARPADKSPTVTDDFTTKHYLRFMVKDRPGIIASLATILAKHRINIDAVLQESGYPKSHLPFLITLEECKASLVTQALEQINALDFMVQACLHLPIL